MGDFIKTLTAPYERFKQWRAQRKRNEEMRERIKQQTTTQHVRGTNYGTVRTTNNSYEQNRAAAAALGPNSLARFIKDQELFNEIASSGNNSGNNRGNNNRNKSGSPHSRNGSNKFNTLNPNNMTGGFNSFKRGGNHVHTRRVRRTIRTKRRTTKR